MQGLFRDHCRSGDLLAWAKIPFHHNGGDDALRDIVVRPHRGQRVSTLSFRACYNALMVQPAPPLEPHSAMQGYLISTQMMQASSQGNHPFQDLLLSF
ncbi:hypothetical protein ACJRO7_007747 [Eucalyptus globulus]|uniref:Uncharacterized protein n=1 Tax=Eucalyptus globulus TaxID=34317 RepID=A0ABD3IP21_EUCGL